MAINTGIGLGVGIPFKRTKLSEKSYIEPNVLASLCGVWISDQNTNESPTRNIIKNKLKDRGGNFEILNAAYAGNSGYSLYEENFKDSSWLPAINNILHNKITFSMNGPDWFLFKHSAKSGIAQMKVTISGINVGDIVNYNYYNGTKYIAIELFNGITIIPESKVDTTKNAYVGFSKNSKSNSIIIIEQIPEYKGAFITDGIDDLIISQKSVSEMLGDSSEITVISMMNQIKESAVNNSSYTNYINGNTGYIRNQVVDTKLGIYGYTATDIYSTNIKGNVVNNILGDKNDYQYDANTNIGLDNNTIFSVQNYIKDDNTIGGVGSQVAWYWTLIANRVLTSDQINQVIEYFNLDKYVKPDVLYNVKKQGITNDNHAQFGDKLIDYSGNGRDMQLYNIAWYVDSGIGKYATSLGAYCDVDSMVENNAVITSYYFQLIKPLEGDSLYADEIKYTNYQTLLRAIRGIRGTPQLKITNLPKGGKLKINPNSYGESNVIIVEQNGLCDIPNINGGFSVYKPDVIDYTGLKIELVPEHEGALVLDGVNDYGKVENMPIYKDYTVVVDRKILNKDTGTNSSVLSKSKKNQSNGIEYGAFIFEMSVNNYSFNYYPTNIGNNNYNKDRMFSYLTKYSYNGLKNVDVGTATDSNSMWLGTIRDNDPRFSNLVFYSTMLFPYSLSKFLIERQLKKHKVGTMYEDMVRFLPIINNIDYTDVAYYVKDSDIQIEIGNYISTGYGFDILVRFKANIEIDRVIFENNNQIFFKTSITNEYVEYKITIDNVSKYPQKIDIVTYKVIDIFKVPTPFPIIVEYEDLNGVIYDIYTEHAVNCTIPVKIHKVINLLPELYRVDNYTLVYNNKEIIFTSIDNIKDQWFKLSLINSFKANTTYLLDNNPPKCILSHSILKLPNYAYAKMLYIPDISGNGNNGVPVNNDFYSELSGPQSNGSWKLDGVDDFIVINDLSIGGQQMFMKLSFDSNGALAYDQRDDDIINEFAMYVGGATIAYNFRNSGDTFINSILNKNVLARDFNNIIHNVTMINSAAQDRYSRTPVIGSNTNGKDYFAKMVLYTFMLFDKISSPEKIKELNEIIGINPIIETPPYYYDAYGKTNLDTDKAQLVNLGSGGEHTLNIQNIAYEAMSGYGGYTFPNFDYWSVTGGNILIDVDTVTPYHVDITNITESDQWQWCRYISEGQFALGGSGKAIFKCDKNIGFIIDLKYKKAGDTIDNTAEFFKQTIYANTPTEVFWTYKTQEELDALGAVSYWYLVYFWLLKGVEYSIDMFPEYYNGLVIDGVDDYVINTTIPVFTDYTYILKRELLDSKVGITSLVKGTQTGVGRAFISESKLATGYMEGSFGQDNAINIQQGTITYGTKLSYNGKTISSGSEEDKLGLSIGKLWSTYNKMVFYKLMLYPKTLDMLQINMLKNLFELDEKIDINNPIFKEPEQGGGRRT